MDQMEEEEQDRQSLPQQEQQTQRQGRPPTPPSQQQQWPQQQQRMPTFPVAQQSHFPTAAGGQRRPFPGAQEMQGNPPPVAAAATMLHPPGRGHHPQHPGATSMNYAMHQSPPAASYAAAAASAYGPQHAYAQPPPQPMYHHQAAQMAMQQQQQQQPLHMQQQQPIGVPMMGQHHRHPQPAQPYIQPTAGRLPKDRPLVKLSVSLIDTYKRINMVYYEERDARRAARAAQKAQKGQGANNNGWDDDNYDYILTTGELFSERYIIKERIGKGSFGQVVRAVDTLTNKDVAIKIIKSKKPFLMQAKTEIELLSHLTDKDPDDQNNIVRLVTHFIYRNHQCLVFEMLSLNLYELLKNTQFGGVSLNLIRKFAKQILKALSFLARPDVDIIHCDLKPENILLRHPKRSGVKVIDFGSSCRSNKRMYSYIQSRFYRSPEVMLGLPYSVAIDMWSLGCILVEMHTGEPLFSGSDQSDQMQKIVKLLGMVPSHMVDQASDTHRLQFFERPPSEAGTEEWVLKQSPSSSSQPKLRIAPSDDPIASLLEIVTTDPERKKKHPPSETGNSPRNYDMFVDLVYKMLAFDPKQRLKAAEALNHPFIVGEGSSSQPPSSVAMVVAAEESSSQTRRKRSEVVTRRSQQQQQQG